MSWLWSHSCGLKLPAPGRQPMRGETSDRCAIRASAVGLRPSLDPDPFRGARNNRVGARKRGWPTLLTGPAPSGMTCGNRTGGVLRFRSRMPLVTLLLSTFSPSKAAITLIDAGAPAVLDVGTSSSRSAVTTPSRDLAPSGARTLTRRRVHLWSSDPEVTEARRAGGTPRLPNFAEPVVRDATASPTDRRGDTFVSC
jgi:hypothetical protein